MNINAVAEDGDPPGDRRWTRTGGAASSRTSVILLRRYEFSGAGGPPPVKPVAYRPGTAGPIACLFLRGRRPSRMDVSEAGRGRVLADRCDPVRCFRVLRVIFLCRELCRELCRSLFTALGRQFSMELSLEVASGFGIEGTSQIDDDIHVDVLSDTTKLATKLATKFEDNCRHRKITHKCRQGRSG